jgi:hypothetical protein
MKKIIVPGIYCFMFFLFVSCGNEKQEFTISGEISGNADKILYLENIGTSKITILDDRIKFRRFYIQTQSPCRP